MVMKTDFSKVLREFFDKMEKLDPVNSLKENGCIDKVTMHIACICTRQESGSSFFDVSCIILRISRILKGIITEDILTKDSLHSQI